MLQISRPLAHSTPPNKDVFALPLEDAVRMQRRRGYDRKRDLVPIEKLRPTQMAVGMLAVAAKRERVESRTGKAKKLLRFLEKRPIPAVLGPEDSFYIIDHHHLSLALWQSNVHEAFVDVVDDLSHLAKRHFYARMTEMGWIHPFDESGRRVAASQLPDRLNALRSDAFRDLAWSVREGGGFLKSSLPYSEFHWANFFRKHIAKPLVRRDFEKARYRALRLARSPEAAHLPGFVGR